MTKEDNKNTAQAVGKSLKTSVQKANLVLKTIRGQKAEDALNSLAFSRKRISEQVSKILSLLFQMLKTTINLILISCM